MKAIACLIAVFGLGLCSSLAVDPSSVMNRGGVPYQISNPTPASQGVYSTDFQANQHGPVDHFDVYGEVRTKYSQVYWTRNLPIELPPALVARFKGKVMAITGYEIDQVTHTADQNSSTNGNTLGGFSCYPDCSETDKSVPMYNAYNHHYYGWLIGADSEVYEREIPAGHPPTKTGVRNRKASLYPTNIVFKENPGGEYRKSYHGYPAGYGQLLASPTQWLVEPMQIDTHNRKYDINDPVGYQVAFLPKQDTANNFTDVYGSLSPLIECPCTDRIGRLVINSSAIITSGTCQTIIDSQQACTDAISGIANVTKSSTINTPTWPHGCVMVPDATTPNTFAAVFNTNRGNQKRPTTCGSGDQSYLVGSVDLGGLTTLGITHNGSVATITMSGPDKFWFGVGFNAQAMADLPYAVIVDGTGAITERSMGDHDPGTQLPNTVTPVSNTVTAGIRTVTFTRAVQGASASYYTFPAGPGEINVITAIGMTPQISYHKAHTTGRIVMLPSQGPMCICTPTSHTYLTYMNTTVIEYQTTCADEPRSDMLRHGDGTGRNVSNMACNMQTYHGGLRCCVNQWFLTDVDQASLIPDMTDRYFLKWRYYFQEYVEKTPTAPASHIHLHHYFFMIDADVNDYEEDNFPDKYGNPNSVGKITAHLTGAGIGLEDRPGNYSFIIPIMMTPHCHAPSCIREELWNGDTNEIICNVTASYGDIKYGPTTGVFNEQNYIAISPCLWGFQDGIPKPSPLTAATKLTAIKYFNNTYRHIGQMAQWTGMMVYDTDPY